MPTSDRSTGLPELELEGPLREAFAFAPPEAASAAADRRIAAAIARSAAGDGRDRRPSPGFGSRLSLSIGRMSRRTRVVAVLAGVLVLGGAGGGVLGMYEGMIGSQGGARTAWDLATIVGASQTVDGYRVTIDRAYADSNQLMLAVSVTDRENRGWTQVSATSMNVTDERGRSFDGFDGHVHAGRCGTGREPGLVHLAGRSDRRPASSSRFPFHRSRFATTRRPRPTRRRRRRSPTRRGCRGTPWPVRGRSRSPSRCTAARRSAPTSR